MTIHNGVITKLFELDYDNKLPCQSIDDAYMYCLTFDRAIKRELRVPRLVFQCIKLPKQTHTNSMVESLSIPVTSNKNENELLTSTNI